MYIICCFKNQTIRGCMICFLRRKKSRFFLFVIYDFSRIKIVIYSKSLRSTGLWDLIFKILAPEMGFEKGLNIQNRPSKPTIDFLEMLTSMGGFLCPLVRRLVKQDMLKLSSRGNGIFFHEKTKIGMTRFCWLYMT